MHLIRADLHVHTSASADGCSQLDALTAAARERGLDAIAVADHNLCTPCPQEQNGILVIPGCEISTAAGHITGLFLDSPVDLEALGHLPPPEQAVAAIRAAGGLAVLAHPFQRPGTAANRFAFSVDAVETANARAELRVRDANLRAEFLARDRSLPRIGGSDAHHASEVGNAFTEIECAFISLEALRSAVAQGRTRAVLQRKTTHREKGRSQWAKARKSRSIPQLCRGAAYWCCCVLLDALKRRSLFPQED